MLGSILVSRTSIKSSRNSTDEEERKERFLQTKVEDGVVVMIVFPFSNLADKDDLDRGQSSEKIIQAIF